MLQLKKLIQFQGCWLAVVLGQAYDWRTEGLIVAALLFVWSLFEDKKWQKELVFSFGLGILGWILDSCLIRMQLFSFPQSASEFAPFWMVALWWTFSLGLEDFYLILVRKPKLLFVLGAVLGPVSYYACEEFGLLFYKRPLWLYLGMHAMLWALLFPGIVWVKHRFKN